MKNFTRRNNWLDVSFLYYCNIIKIILRTVVVFNIRQSLYALDRIKNNTYIIIKKYGYLSKYSNINMFNSKKSIEQHSLIGFQTYKVSYIPNGVDINSNTDNDKIKTP